MGRPLYTWEVTEKRKHADGSTEKFTAKRTGRKPPKNAKNVRRNGGPVLTTAEQRRQLEAELERLDQLDAEEAAAEKARQEAEEKHKAEMAKANQARAEQLQAAADQKAPAPEPTEPPAEKKNNAKN